LRRAPDIPTAIVNGLQSHQLNARRLMRLSPARLFLKSVRHVSELPRATATRESANHETVAERYSRQPRARARVKTSLLKTSRH
jgi:hypothetical protein